MSPARCTLAALLLAGALTACDGTESTGPGGPPGPEPSASVSVPPADPDSYLPVPEGLDLTAPGTGLGLRERAVAAWTPRQDVVGVVDVAVTRIQRTTVAASLADYDFRGADATATPHFVTARVMNVGDADLGGRQLPLYAVDSTGRTVAPTGIDAGFRPCPGGVLPATFGPGASAPSCLIFLVPRGAELDAVTFRPPEGIDPLTWTGPVQRVRGTDPDPKADRRRS